MALTRILCTPVLPMLGSASELLDIFKHVKQLVFLKLIIVSTIHSFIHIRLLKTEMTERICTSNRNTRRI